MENISNLAEMIRSITVIVTALGALGAVVVVLLRVCSGIKCLLRAGMLHTYYKCRESGEIRQYEMENFKMEYAAYKALRGNSFIEDIHDTVCTWTVIS